MAKNPIAKMMAQAVAPGAVKAPAGKIVAPTKGVQKSVPGIKTTPALRSPGLPPPPPVDPGQGFGGGTRPIPANPFGKKR